jgi:hypothetical protein
MRSDLRVWLVALRDVLRPRSPSLRRGWGRVDCLEHIDKIGSNLITPTLIYPQALIAAEQKNMTTIAARLSAAVLMMGTAWTVISVPASGAATGQVSSESGWRVTVRDFSAKHFRNPAWGYSHCVRDYLLARELAAADHIALDDDVLFAAA